MTMGDAMGEAGPESGGSESLALRLGRLFPDVSRRRRKRWLADGRVQVDGRPARAGREAVPSAARVVLGDPPPPALAAPLRLVHEDADLLVIEKPPGLLTIATERERGRTAYRLVWDY